MKGVGFIKQVLEKTKGKTYNITKGVRTAMTNEEIELKKEKNMEIIQKMKLMDDTFMTACFQDNPKATELVLRIIMDQEDLLVEKVSVQDFIKNLFGRSVRLDVYATDNTGKKYNIEVQNENAGATPKRARYNSALIDCWELPSGTDWEKLPETYVVFITEKDVLGAGLPIYHVNRYIEEMKQPFQDAAHIIYVNGEIQDDTPLGRLMRDFHCTKAEDMYYKDLADMVKYFKESEEGVKKMCRIADELREEGREEGRAEAIASELLKSVERLQTKMKISVQEALDLLGKTVSEYENAKKMLSK